jgi:hypothetical protein
VFPRCSRAGRGSGHRPENVEIIFGRQIRGNTQGTFCTAIGRPAINAPRDLAAMPASRTWMTRSRRLARSTGAYGKPSALAMEPSLAQAHPKS